jgi:hypothetical protein
MFPTKKTQTWRKMNFILNKTAKNAQNNVSSIKKESKQAQCKYFLQKRLLNWNTNYSYIKEDCKKCTK